MSKRDMTAADVELGIAEAFSRPPQEWALAAVKEADGDVGMTVQDARGITADIMHGRIRHDDPRVAESARVLGEHERRTIAEEARRGPWASGRSSGSGPQGEIEELVEQITSLAGSRLGMSEARAQLYAQGELLRLQEISDSPTAILECLRAHRSSLFEQDRATRTTTS